MEHEHENENNVPAIPEVDTAETKQTVDESAVVPDIPQTDSETDDFMEVEETPVDEFANWHSLPENSAYHNPFRVSKDEKLNVDELLTLPSENIDTELWTSAVAKISNNDNLTDDEKSDLVVALTMAFSLSTQDDIVDDGGKTTLSQQLRDKGGKLIRNHFIKAGRVEDGKRLTGDAAMLRFSSMMGSGNSGRFNMWDSGFAVKIGNISPEDLFDISTRLHNLVEAVGRDTQGQMVSVDDAYIVVEATDWVIEHITTCTIKGWTKEIIRKHLRVTDVLDLLVGSLATSYPNGYPFARNCDFNTGGKGTECDWSTLKAVSEGREIVRLDFRFLSHPDPSVFNHRQLDIISADWETVELKDVEEYRTYLPVTEREVVISDDPDSQWKMTYHVPTYETYRRESLAIINNVKLAVDKSLANAVDLGDDGNIERRNTTLAGLIEKIDLQKNSAWVKEITEYSDNEVFKYGGDSTRDERNTVINMLGTMSRNTDKSDIVKRTLPVFKRESNNSVVGIPNYTCPSCKKGQETYTHRPTIIPIPVVHYFFVLTGTNQDQ